MHRIFLVHGMGNFSAGWSDDIQKQIRGCFDPAAFAFLKRPFDEQFKFVEVTYNNLFNEYLEEAKRQAENLSKWSKLARPVGGDGLGLLDRIVKAASTAPSNKFLVTHLGDVAFFLATDIGELVKNSVALQIASNLQDSFDPARESWSIVAHSLGTRVTTEVLQAGFTAAPSLRAFGRPKVVMMVANVSRLLEGLSPFKTGDVYHNPVFPADDPRIGACEHFINVTHRFDPFAFVREFDPPADFGDGRAFIDDVYHGIKLSAPDITSREVHSLEHYLEHPAVHTTLFRYLLPGSGSRGPAAAEMDKAMAAYRQKTLGAQITNVWKDALANLKNKPFETIAQIFSLWEEYGELIS